MQKLLIDSENVGTNWSIPSRGKAKVFLFYGVNNTYVSAKQIKEISSKLQGEYVDDNKGTTYDLLPYSIINNKIELETIKCSQGKNALDFQLVSYLGFFIFSDPNSEYIIVSDDTGYDPVVKMWNNKGVKVRRIGKDKKIIEEKKKMITKPKYQKKTIVYKNNEEKVKDFFYNEVFEEENNKIVENIFTIFIKNQCNLEKTYRTIKSIYGKKKGSYLEEKMRYNQEKILNYIHKLNTEVA